MTIKTLRKILSFLTASMFVVSPLTSVSGASGQSSAPAVGGNPTDAAAHSPSELQPLVAPIALYPDALVAQILPATVQLVVPG